MKSVRKTSFMRTVKIVYLQVLQAIYGCIKSALLWCNLFAIVLKGIGYVINPYDNCVTDRFIGDKRCIIMWYLNDNKLQHVEKDVIRQELDTITEHFGDLNISRGD